MAPWAPFKKSNPSPFDQYFLGYQTTQSRFAESYRTLRTNTQFSFMDTTMQTLLVTSATESEGKTTTVANLAYSFAQAGYTVLSIDADLRRPMLSRISKGQRQLGLSGLLSNGLGQHVTSGRLTDYSVSDLYRLLSLQKRSGVLTLKEGPETITFSFQNGTLVDVYWVSRPGEKKLANLLVERNIITKDQALDTINRSRSTGQKLGFILINLGLIKESELAGFISLHMEEGLRLAISFTDGTFAFERRNPAQFARQSYNPTDLHALYEQVVVGDEHLPYIDQQINNAVQTTEFENLTIMPSGSPPPKPAELLGSGRMRYVVDILKKRFDILLFDSPPVILASDALHMAQLVDGVLLVIKSGSTNRELAKKAVEQLNSAHANIIGTVLNQADIKRDGYYKYYSRYYGKD